VLALLLSALPGSGISTAAGQQEAGTSVLEGFVLDERLGTPIQQALIRLLDGQGEAVTMGVTNRDGWFALRTPGTGTFRLQSSALGYHAEESGEFSLPPGRVLSIEIRLEPSPVPLESMEVLGERRALRATEQLIQGTLLDAETGQPLAQARVSLLKAFGSGLEEVDLVEEVVSGRDGYFSFITPLPGTYRLRSERMGYLTTNSPDLFMMPGDTIFLDLLMGVDAFVMDPLVIRATARPWANRYSLLGMESFFHRQSRFGNSGTGEYITRDMLARHEGRMETNRILLSSAMSVRALNDGGGVILPHGCNPRYYLNNVEIVRGDGVHEPMMGADPSTPMSFGLNLEALYPPEALEAIEVYVSPTIPAEFSEGYPCGVVALWTRRR
jgi:5-hydroxyisourate hydrolase-like protein (transthyretin family)